MGNENNFTSIYDEKTQILIGKVNLDIIEKEDAKNLYELTVEGINSYPDYKDYILDTSMVSESNMSSAGYLLKTHNLVKKTAGYLVMVMQEERLQQFMLTNPEMFDYFAVFFHIDDAIEFVMSKR